MVPSSRQSTCQPEGFRRGPFFTNYTTHSTIAQGKKEKRNLRRVRVFRVNRGGTMSRHSSLVQNPEDRTKYRLTPSVADDTVVSTFGLKQYVYSV